MAYQPNPAMTESEALSACAAAGLYRGHEHDITTANRAHVRRWLVAKGWPAAFVAVLSLKELKIAFAGSDQKGNGVPGRDRWLDKRLAAWQARGEGGHGDQVPGEAADYPQDDAQRRADYEARKDEREARKDERDGAADTPEDNALEKLIGEMEAQAERDGAAPDADTPDLLDEVIKEPRLPLGPPRKPNPVADKARNKAQELQKLIEELAQDALFHEKQKAKANEPELNQADLEAFIRKIAKEEIAKQPVALPQVVEIQRDGELIAQIEGRLPPWFNRVLKLLARGQNIMLVGPAGCGKTYVARKLAEALTVDYSAIHGSAGASESQLTGWLLPVEANGKFGYVPSPFVRGYEGGNTLFLLDEIDGFDSNMLLVINGALANGHLHVAHRYQAPDIARGDKFYVLATANTYGTGANPLYAGRAPLDGSTLDRFIQISVDYDTGLEAEIAASNGLSNSERDAIWSLRDKVRKNNLRRIVSTRAFQKAGDMKAVGDDWPTVMTTLTAGWTADERQKAGLGAGMA